MRPMRGDYVVSSDSGFYVYKRAFDTLPYGPFYPPRDPNSWGVLIELHR